MEYWTNDKIGVNKMGKNIKKTTLNEIKDMIQFCLENDWKLSKKQLNELNKMINILEEYVNGKQK